jgi:hypothetical protein
MLVSAYEPFIQFPVVAAFMIKIAQGVFLSSIHQIKADPQQSCFSRAVAGIYEDKPPRGVDTQTGRENDCPMDLVGNSRFAPQRA